MGFAGYFRYYCKQFVSELSVDYLAHSMLVMLAFVVGVLFDWCLLLDSCLLYVPCVGRDLQVVLELYCCYCFVCVFFGDCSCRLFCNCFRLALVLLIRLVWF